MTTMTERGRPGLSADRMVRDAKRAVALVLALTFAGSLAVLARSARPVLVTGAALDEPRRAQSQATPGRPNAAAPRPAPAPAEARRAGAERAAPRDPAPRPAARRVRTRSS